MPRKRTTRNAAPLDTAAIDIPRRTLRAFVAGLARLCSEIGLVQYDIACEFTRRAGKDFATVRAGFNRARRAFVVEDVVPVLMRGGDAGRATNDAREDDTPDDGKTNDGGKMKNEGGGSGQGKAGAVTRRPSHGDTKPRGGTKR